MLISQTLIYTAKPTQSTYNLPLVASDKQSLIQDIVQTKR